MNLSDTQIAGLDDLDLEAQIEILRQGWEIADFGTTNSHTCVSASRSIYDLDLFPSKTRYRFRKIDDGRELPYFPALCDGSPASGDNRAARIEELGIDEQGAQESDRACAERICRELRDRAA